MNEEYQKVFNYLRSKARIHLHPTGEREIVLPPVLAVSEALQSLVEDIEAIYKELLERGVIRQYSDYEYVAGFNFPITDNLRNKLNQL